MRYFFTPLIVMSLVGNAGAADIKPTKNKPAVDKSSKSTAKPITAKLSGTAWVTKDLDASIKFYSEYLNFSIKKRIVLDSEASAAVFGVETQSLNYVSMVAAGWTREKPNGPDLNFIEIPSARPGKHVNNVNRESFLSEAVVAYSVKNLAEIERRMRADDVPVVVPLAPSASGRSLTLTVLDPNGVRVQMYEFGL